MAADSAKDVVALTPAQAAGGQKQIGEATMIAWEPSSTEVAVKVTIMFQGTIIAQKTLRPSELTMNYNGTSGEDYTRGRLKAQIASVGVSGQIDTEGAVRWQVSGSEGSFTGFIGAWSVP